MATTATRNGVDLEQLVETIEAIKKDPDLGTFRFRASSRWEDGTFNRGRIGTFVHAGQSDGSWDEPFELEGDEPAPSRNGRERKTWSSCRARSRICPWRTSRSTW